MKSLRYLIARQPRSLDDCLDLCHKERPEKTTVELDREESLLDFNVLYYLIGCYTWEFPGRTVACRRIYGVYFSTDSEKKKQKHIARANLRLASQLQSLAHRGIRVCRNGESIFIAR